MHEIRNHQNDLDREDAVKRSLCIHNLDGTPYKIPEGHWFPGSMIPDFTNPETCITWFGKRQYLLDMGVDGWTVLEKLHAVHIPMAIGSSSKNTPLIVEKLGIGKFFDVIVDGNQISHSKPDPEVFLLAAEKLHQKPSDCLVVEDAEAGVKAALNGGFLVAGIGPAKDCPNINYPLLSLSELLAIEGHPA